MLLLAGVAEICSSTGNTAVANVLAMIAVHPFKALGWRRHLLQSCWSMGLPDAVLGFQQVPCLQSS